MYENLKEDAIHQLIVNYFISKYPTALLNTDLSGIRMPMGLALKAKKLRSHNGFPDIVSYEPKCGYSGLFIELKKSGIKLYKKNGERVKNTHFNEQHEMIELLQQRGFYATFAVGYDMAIQIIDGYMNCKIITNV